MTMGDFTWLEASFETTYILREPRTLKCQAYCVNTGLLRVKGHIRFSFGFIVATPMNVW